MISRLSPTTLPLFDQAVRQFKGTTSIQGRHVGLGGIRRDTQSARVRHGSGRRGVWLVLGLSPRVARVVLDDVPPRTGGRRGPLGKGIGRELLQAVLVGSSKLARTRCSRSPRRPIPRPGRSANPWGAQSEQQSHGGLQLLVRRRPCSRHCDRGRRPSRRPGPPTRRSALGARVCTTTVGVLESAGNYRGCRSVQGL